MQPEYARTLAQTAYLWGWPMVNMMNRRAMFAQAPHPGRLNGVVPVAPPVRSRMLYRLRRSCGNLCHLSRTRTLSMVSASSSRQGARRDRAGAGLRRPLLGLCALRCAHRPDRQLGKPYKYQARILSARRSEVERQKPAGIAGVSVLPPRSPMPFRAVFQDDTAEDRRAIQPAINQIVFYPLKDFTGKMKTIEWSKAPNIPGPKSTGEETKWVVPEKFFDELGDRSRHRTAAVRRRGDVCAVAPDCST